MGWRGTIRAIGAAQRRMEREAVRKQRELDRTRKAHAELQELEQAAYEVDRFQTHVQVLRSIHKDCGPVLDWAAFRDAAAPVAPARHANRENAARRALEAFEPGWLDRLLGRTERKRAALEETVNSAKREDDAEHARALAEHREREDDWAESRTLAVRVLGGDPQAYVEVIDELSPFAEITGLGSAVQFRVHDPVTVEAVLQVNSEEVIPLETRSLLQSGKLSVKKMPQGQFLELYQDYVCACVLRVSSELMALLPVQMVIVTAVGEVLDPATGHLEARPIVSAAIPRRTLERLNFDQLDPSDSLRNFAHRMDFKKSRGFTPVQRIHASELQPPT
jgi:hypothetical protein